MRPLKIFSLKLPNLFYRIILPIITVLFLLIVASFVNRPILFKSIIADFIIRALLTIWFCGIYFRVSNLSKYRIYPNITWTKSDVQSYEKYVYISLIIISGLFLIIITWWVVRIFFPFISNCALPIAILNGVLVTIPAISQYWVFKL